MNKSQRSTFVAYVFLYMLQSNFLLKSFPCEDTARGRFVKSFMQCKGGEQEDEMGVSC